MKKQVGLRKHNYKKASGGDGFPVELFQILKDYAVKVLHSVCQQIWKAQQWPWDHFHSTAFIPIPKKGNAKECSNHDTIALISHASKLTLQILQQYVNQTANMRWIIEKAIEFQKIIYFCFTDDTKAFDCVDHNTLENS